MIYGLVSSEDISQASITPRVRQNYAIFAEVILAKNLRWGNLKTWVKIKLEFN